MKGEKKQENFPWKKVFVIAVGVLFVFMMVLSAMGMSWLQSFRSVMTNDTVTIGLTLRDAYGRPIFTTDENLYRTGITAGVPVFLAAPLTVRAGYAGNPGVNGNNAQNYYLSEGGQQLKFGLLGQELDEIDIAVLSMKKGDVKTISFSYAEPLELTLDSKEFTAMGGNFTQTSPGDLIPLGISETPVVEGSVVNSTAQNTAWRIGTIASKTANSIVVDHRYPTADITVEKIG